MKISEFRKWAKSQNIALIDEQGGFKTGEIVDVINGYGMLIENKQIKGFDANPSKNRPGATVYVYDDAYWFAVELERIIKKK